MLWQSATHTAPVLVCHRNHMKHIGDAVLGKQKRKAWRHADETGWLDGSDGTDVWTRLLLMSQELACRETPVSCLFWSGLLSWICLTCMECHQTFISGIKICFMWSSYHTHTQGNNLRNGTPWLCSQVNSLNPFFYEGAEIWFIKCLIFILCTQTYLNVIDDRVFFGHGVTLPLRMTSSINAPIGYRSLGNSLHQGNITGQHKHQFIMMSENIV